MAAFAAVGNEKGDKRTNSIVLATDEIQVGGKLIAVVQAMNARGFIGGTYLNANKVITTYDRAALTRDIEKAALEGRLLYLDKKRSQTMFAGWKPSDWETTIRIVDFNKNIQDFWSNVKWAESGKDSYFINGSPDEKGTFARVYEEAERKKNEQYSISKIKGEKEKATQGLSRGVTVSGSLADTISAASENRVTDNKLPVKEQFSISEPVEQTPKLIAWHNMSQGALKSALELGRLAMPSFAIKTADLPHLGYGDISVIAYYAS